MNDVTTLHGILMGAMGCIISFLLYPPMLRFARRHNIVDNPDARKLQREPVPSAPSSEKWHLMERIIKQEW